MGGENSPDKTIHGVKLFLEKNKSNDDFFLKLFGNKNKLEQILEKYKIKSSQLKLFILKK